MIGSGDKEANPAWREREVRRFEEEYYKQVPWTEMDWYRANRVGDHYVHVSRTNPELLAYTPSPEYGQLDRQMQIKPGRYLAKFFGHILTPAQINEHTGAVRANLAKLEFAKTDIEIERIYRACAGGGATACMSYSRDHFAFGHSERLNKHPVHAYAAGDIQLAYIRSEKGIVARVLVWPEKKIFARPYGDYKQIQAALEAQGYKSGVFDGARLTPILCPTTHYQVNKDPKRFAEHFLFGPFVDHMNWACYDGKELRLQTKATGATHSTQHGDGVIYPIAGAPARAGTGVSPRLDHQKMVAIESGEKPAAPDQALKTMEGRYIDFEVANRRLIRDIIAGPFHAEVGANAGRWVQVAPVVEPAPLLEVAVDPIRLIEQLWIDEGVLDR
jgi:hypothetical protein